MSARCPTIPRPWPKKSNAPTTWWRAVTAPKRGPTPSPGLSWSAFSACATRTGLNRGKLAVVVATGIGRGIPGLDNAAARARPRRSCLA